MNAKQYYDCFPEYTYNTAFGSLLTGPNSVNDMNVQTTTGMCNNSAWHMDCYARRQSLEDTVKLLIDFLGDFLLFLSSIIDCQSSCTQIQSPEIVEIAERIHRLRSTLLMQINRTNEDLLNSSMLDIPSICSILRELASFIRGLGNQQQQIGTIIEHPYTNTLSQLSDRIEKMIKSFMDCVSISNNLQCCPPAMPVLYPCRKWSQLIENPVVSVGCGSPCGESNVCMPWSFLERIANSADEKDHVLGGMYGIKDENLRRKLGYRIGKHSAKRRARQKYRQGQKYDRNGEWIIRSTDGEISPMSNTSMTSMREGFMNTDEREIDERKSYKSIRSQGKNKPNRLGSSRTLSRHQSPINSKNLSSIFRSNSDLKKSLKSPSKHESDSSRRMTPHTTSYTGELPITSMLDHSVSQRTSSRLVQESPSNIPKNDDDISARSLSFRSYGYQTPSKTTIKISRESSQSLSSVPNKSINAQQPNVSTLSPRTSSINDIRKQKTTSNADGSDNKRSFKETNSQNPSIYSTHRDIIDSTVTMTSQENIPPNDNVSNKSWEQRLTSPTLITSRKRSNNPDPTTSNSNFDHNSEHSISRSGSFMNKTHDNISTRNVIEGSGSAEGVEKTPHSFNSTFQKEQSTPQLSSISTYRQQSTSATSDNDALLLFSKTNKASSRSIQDRKRQSSIEETSDLLALSNEQGYFHKFLNCFRRTNVDRSKYYNK